MSKPYITELDIKKAVKKVVKKSSSQKTKEVEKKA